MQGRIIKGIAGFYYVLDEENTLYECKAKGGFRNEHLKPLVGDRVSFDILEGQDQKGNIREILPRQNTIIRPAVANIDGALVIFSMTRPEPNYNLLDRFLIQMEQQGLECALVFNKKDISTEAERAAVTAIYEKAGFPVFFTSAAQAEAGVADAGVRELRAFLQGRTYAVAGPSGVGKSSLINCLQDEVEMETGAISEKNERGKHTTRHSELIRIAKDTYIMDTPGFTSLQVFDLEKEELREYYPEFAEYEGTCKYFGCTHTHEPGCNAKEAVEAGSISRIRYQNYLQIYQELADRKKY